MNDDARNKFMKWFDDARMKEQIEKELVGLKKFLLANHPDVAREYYGKKKVNEMLTEEL